MLSPTVWPGRRAVWHRWRAEMEWLWCLAVSRFQAGISIPELSVCYLQRHRACKTEYSNFHACRSPPEVGCHGEERVCCIVMQIWQIVFVVVVVVPVLLSFLYPGQLRDSPPCCFTLFRLVCGEKRAQDLVREAINFYQHCCRLLWTRWWLVFEWRHLWWKTVWGFVGV